MASSNQSRSYTLPLPYLSRIALSSLESMRERLLMVYSSSSSNSALSHYQLVWEYLCSPSVMHQYPQPKDVKVDDLSFLSIDGYGSLLSLTGALSCMLLSFPLYSIKLLIPIRVPQPTVIPLDHRKKGRLETVYEYIITSLACLTL
jgi:hypothetical protein